MPLWTEPTGETVWCNPLGLTQHSLPIGPPGELSKLSLPRLSPNHIEFLEERPADSFEDSTGVCDEWAAESENR